MQAIIELTFMLCSVLCAAGAVFFLVHFLTPLWDRFAQWQMGSLSSRYRQLGYSDDLLKLSLRIWVIAMPTIGFVLGVVLQMIPLAIALIAILYLAPRRILDLLIRRRARKFRDQLTLAAIGLANAARSGLSPSQGLEEVVSESSLPLKKELEKVCSDYRNGRQLGDALGDRRRALDLDPFTLFSLTIETTLQQGGNLTACLTQLGISLQEEQRLQGKLESDTAAGRQTIFLLSMFPVGFLGIGLVAIPDGTWLLFTSFKGQCVLAAIASMIYVGYGWASRILKFEI